MAAWGRGPPASLCCGVEGPGQEVGGPLPPERRGSLGAGLLPPAGLATAGIRGGLRLWRQGLGQSHRGVCVLGSNCARRGGCSWGPGRACCPVFRIPWPAGRCGPAGRRSREAGGRLHVPAESFPMAPAVRHRWVLGEPCRPGGQEPAERRAGAGLATLGGRGRHGWGFCALGSPSLRPGLRLGSREPQDGKEARGHPCRVRLGGLSATGRGWKAGARV